MICDWESSCGTPSSGGHKKRPSRKQVGNFWVCSIGLRRHGPFISCHIFLPLCFALSGTHLGSSFGVAVFFVGEMLDLGEECWGGDDFQEIFSIQSPYPGTVIIYLINICLYRVTYHAPAHKGEHEILYLHIDPGSQPSL